MELLHLHRADGALIKTFDLAALPRRPLTLGANPAADLPLPEGPATLAALLRDEDGWLLAPADPALPETRLLPGEPAALGPFRFRIERDAVQARATLLWRDGRGKTVHAAPLADGRNALAWLPDHSAPALNPPIPGDKICHLFLEGDTLTLIAGDAEGSADRLAFALGDRFAIGSLQGLALPTPLAERALRTRNPLAWPDRRIRLLLRVAAVVGLILGLILLALARQANALRAELDARAPAVVALPAPELPADADPLTRDAVIAYGQLFHACLPGLLDSPEAAASGDLLARRAEELLNGLPKDAPDRIPLARKWAFLKNLADLKRAVADGDWPRLGPSLDALDADVLAYYDADRLLADAHALDRYFNQAYPEACRDLCRGGAPASVEPRRQTLRDNRFRGLPIVAKRLDALDRHWAALLAWHDADQAFGGSAAGADALDACDAKGILREALYDLEDATDALEDPALDALLRHVRDTLSGRVEARIAARCGEGDALLAPNIATPGELRALARLARALGTPRAQAAAQRAQARADAIVADYERRCRALIVDYRLKRLAGDAPAADAILAQILALGPADSPFWAWAQREQARAAKPGVPQPEDLP